MVVANPSSIEVTAPTPFKITKIPTLTSITPTFGSDAQFLTVTITGGPFVSGVTVSLEHPPDSTIVGRFRRGFPGPSHGALFRVRSARRGAGGIRRRRRQSWQSLRAAARRLRGSLWTTSRLVDAVLGAGHERRDARGHRLEPHSRRDGEAHPRRTGRHPGNAVGVGAGGTSLTAAFDVRGRLADAWNVVVTNPDGLSAMLPGAFLVQKVPVVTAIAPTFVTDDELITATISGSHFVTGVTVRLERASTLPIAGVVLALDPAGTSFDASFDMLHAGPPPGFYDVVVINPGNIEGRLPTAFEVRTVPHVVSYSPVSGFDSSVVICTIVGRLFDVDATARLVAPSLPTIVGTGTVVSADRNSVTTTFDLRGRPRVRARSRSCSTTAPCCRSTMRSGSTTTGSSPCRRPRRTTRWRWRRSRPIQRPGPRPRCSRCLESRPCA